MSIIALAIAGSQNDSETEVTISESDSKIHKMNELVIHSYTDEDTIAVKLLDASIVIDQKTPKGSFLGSSYEIREPGKYHLKINLEITNLGNEDYEKYPYDFKLVSSDGKRYTPETKLGSIFGSSYSKGENFKTSIKYLVDPPLANYTLEMSQSWSDVKTKISIDDIEKFKPSLCQGTATCVAGLITKVVDGDTLDLEDVETGEEIRIKLTLVDTPEKNEELFDTAKGFTEGLCSIGTYVLFDEDDGQTQGSFGRLIGKLYCEGVLLNKKLLEHDLATIDTRFCQDSEYASEDWVTQFGC